MRCFIAIELDDEIKDNLQTAQQFFKSIPDEKVNWTKRSQMHLTLKFLGEASEDQIPKIIDAIQSSAAEIAPFDLPVAGLGSFPPSGSPRVLWAGVQRSESLQKLQKSIEATVSPLGFPSEDRDFTPHLTLGRVKERIDPKTAKTIIQNKQNFTAGTQHVTKITLFSSTLKPTGSVYTRIAEISLTQ